ncbi:unnamed protein product, partial [Owenia fusiformis]
DGGWGEFSNYSACSLECGGGTQERVRLCNNPEPQYGGSQCLTVEGVEQLEESQIEPCNTQPCPIDGGWGEFSNYSACSLECGGGTRERVRLCNNPEPQYGGSQCLTVEGVEQLEESQVEPCNTQPCPIDGGWGEFSNYSACSLECGGGTQERVRLCNNPEPQYGGSQCRTVEGVEQLEESQVEPCNTQPCPIDGGWGEFSNYSACSLECGGGTQERVRL